MSAVIQALRKEIKRLAKKATARLQRANARLKRKNATLKWKLKKLLRTSKASPRSKGKRKQAVPGKALKVRVKGKTILAMRKKLGLSQADFARLLQVSSVSVGLWERKSGALQLRSKAMDALARVKSMGAREAKGLLAGLPVKAKKAAKPVRKAVQKAGEKAKRGRKA